MGLIGEGRRPRWGFWDGMTTVPHRALHDVVAGAPLVLISVLKRNCSARAKIIIQNAPTGLCQ